MSTRPATLRELQRSACERIAREDVTALLCHALQRSTAWLVAHDDALLTPEQQASFVALVERRAAGEPVAYLIGSRGFWTLDLAVTPATLIPRPETELLVEAALARIPADTSCNVLDLGTGSGAIALAIGKERPHANVTAIDASVDALAVATANATRNRIDNVSFVQSDWFDAVGAACFDVIVSNPPYIDADDPHLRQGDLRFEPITALASGTDGLEALRVIIAGACVHLNDHGWLLVEHGWQQGAAVRALFAAAGFAELKTLRDLEGRERVTQGQWRGGR